MWKSTTTSAAPVAKPTTDNDDWDTDPDYVNSVSEKDQRWVPPPSAKEEPRSLVDLSQLRQQVVSQNEMQSKQQWESQNGKNVKESYGVGSKPKKL